MNDLQVMTTLLSTAREVGEELARKVDTETVAGRGGVAWPRRDLEQALYFTEGAIEWIKKAREKMNN
jgi:hypothetical protein